MCLHYVHKLGVNGRLIFICRDGGKATLSITARSDVGQGVSCELTRDEIAKVIDEMQGVLDDIDMDDARGVEDDDD